MAKDNLIADTLSFALSVWDEKIDEVYVLVTMPVEEFRGGQIWAKVCTLTQTLQSIAFALFTLFFLVGIIRTYLSFEELRRPETAIKILVRFALGKILIDYSSEILTAVMKIGRGIAAKAMGADASFAATSSAIPGEILSAIDKCTFLQSVPLFAVALICTVTVWILSVRLVLIVYARFFRIYLYTAVSPIALASFASEKTQTMGVNFIRSYVSVTLEGLVIVLSLIIFSLFATTAPAVSEGGSAASMVWRYMGELIFNMLILNALISASDRLVRELFI